jgi:hypothetical protein
LVSEAPCGIDRQLVFLVLQVALLVTQSHRSTTGKHDAEIDTRELASAMELWKMDFVFRSLATRVQIGSLAMWHACKILLAVELDSRSRSDVDIQASANVILHLCLEVGDKVEFMNWVRTTLLEKMWYILTLIQPLLIACWTLVDTTQRPVATQLLRAFSFQCCFENQALQIIVREIWRRMDTGYDHSASGWKEVMVELGMSVIIG